MIIDIVVGAIVLISAIISFLRGLIRETLTIAGVAAGLFAAITFGPILSPVFRSWLGVAETKAEGSDATATQEVAKLFDIIPMTIVADVCAYAAIFVLVVIIVSVISHFTAGAAKAMGLGPIDRTLGVIFGIVRAVLLLALLYLPFHLLMDEDSKAKYFADSKTHIYIEKTAEFMVRFLPSSKDVEDKVNEVKDGQIKKKLYENNILTDENAKPVEKKETPSETGYQKDQRQDLNELIGKDPVLKEPEFNE